MPVTRITSQINLKLCDNVILVYGHVNDTFITGDLVAYDNDGIEKLLCRCLIENGYSQVIYYSPARQMYVYDERSYGYCFPAPMQQEAEKPGPGQLAGPVVDGRPLGNTKLLRRSGNAAGAATSRALPKPGNNIRWNELEGYIPVVSGSDHAIIEIIRQTLFTSSKQRKNAVIISHFDAPTASSEIIRNLLPVIALFSGHNTQNKCIIVTNASTPEQLQNIIAPIPVLCNIVRLHENQAGLDSLLYIGFPGKDEICYLLNRFRILHGADFEWPQITRIEKALIYESVILKRRFKELQHTKRIDINSVNPFLKTKISTDEHSALEKLESLIGLAEVKKKIRLHLHQIKYQRSENPNNIPLMHILLKGNPGTGKTTLARIIAEIFRDEGMLERGHLVEVDREKMVGRYVGETAIKTDKCCREALGGVLFIDEAYSLARGTENDAGDNNDFGKEAIDTLIKRMSDWQDRFCVILAGYPDEMDNLLNANPGFAGRIGLTVHIADYQPEELAEILFNKLERKQEIAGTEMEVLLMNGITRLHWKRGKRFDNARTIDLLVNQIRSKHLERCLNSQLAPKNTPLTKEDLPDNFDSSPLSEGDPMDRLNKMIGLEKVKQQIQAQLDNIERLWNTGQKQKKNRLHLVFKGNPGTGKTTVAELVGQIYKKHNILSNNQFIPASRSTLVGAAMGQTARNVKAVVKEALGGVLFIDEVYTLVNDEHDSFGKEAVEALMQEMDIHHDNICVIIAGYPDKLKRFFEINPGLRRRFPVDVDFEDYTAEELFEVFKKIIAESNTPFSNEAMEAMNNICNALYMRRMPDFGNAGEIENCVQRTMEQYSTRCRKNKLSYDTTPVEKTDIPEDLLKLLPQENPDETINEALKELNELVGLEGVKKYIQNLVRNYKHNTERRKLMPQLKADRRSYHMIFSGNPGTGKTTVAKIIGKIFKSLDILKTGNVIVSSRADFVAGYSGQTAGKTRQFMLDALDNVLFIDEAYSLVNDGTDGFGSEAVSVIIQLMEEYKDRLVVVAAGYPLAMKQFLRNNSGLASRFPNDLMFADYNVSELNQILQGLIAENKYELHKDVLPKLNEHMAFLKSKKSIDFGNARDVNNYFFHEVLPKYQERVESLNTDDVAYNIITLEDFPEINAGKAGPIGSRRIFRPDKEEAEQKNQTAQINQLHHGKGDNIAGNKYVTNNYPSASKELPRYLSSLPSFDGLNIIGREEIVNEIHHALGDPGKPDKVLLYGITGIGKTKVLLQLLQQYGNTYDHVIWIAGTDSLQKSLVENKLLSQNLGVNFAEKDDESMRYAKIVAKLTKLDKNTLLVIDGASGKIQQELANLPLDKFKIIAAAREKFAFGHAIKLESLQPDDGCKLFNQLSENRFQGEQIQQLLEPIGYHPLAVEMLARLAASNGNMHFSRLLQLVNDGLHIRKGALSMEYELNADANDELIKIFSTLISVSDISEREKEMLCHFSVLPPVPMPIAMLYALLDMGTDEQKDELHEVMVGLIKRGFISEEKGRGLFSHQIVQQVCRNEFQPTLENCTPLFLALGVRLGDKIDRAEGGKVLYELAGAYLYLLEYFVRFFMEEQLFISRVFINMSVLYRINGEFEKSIAVSLKEKAALEPQKNKYPLWYAITVRNLAVTYMNQGRYAEARQLYEDNTLFLETIKPEETELQGSIKYELMLCYSQLGFICLSPGAYNTMRATEYFEKGITLGNGSENETSAAMALLYQGLALAQIETNNCEKAIENLTLARSIYEGVFDENSLPFGEVNIFLSIAYAGRKLYDSAITYVNMAIEILKMHVPEDNLQFGNAYYIFGNIYLQFALDKLDESNEVDKQIFQQSANYMQKAIRIVEYIFGTGHTDLAMIYSSCGIALKYSKGDEEGYSFHKKAVDLCKNIEGENELVAGIFFRTVTFFEEQASPADAEASLRNALKRIPESPENKISFAYIHYCLGIILHKNDNSREGINELIIALDLIRENYGKTGPGTGTDSPFEVLCLEERASIKSDIADHNAAIIDMREAIEICEANMAPDEEELPERYLAFSKIYMAAALDKDETQYDAGCLEYKTKVERLNPKLFARNRQLDESGMLYLVKTKSESGSLIQAFVVIPSRRYARFAEDYQAGRISSLNNYGHVLSGEYGSTLSEKLTAKLTETYGRLNTQFAHN